MVVSTLSLFINKAFELIFIFITNQSNYNRYILKRN